MAAMEVITDSPRNWITSCLRRDPNAFRKPISLDRLELRAVERFM
jgi:hypothetical protein